MANSPSQRRLAAILVADMVGYSRLVELDETATLSTIKALQSQVIEPTVTKWHGRIVKLMGDGALVEFTSVVDAVRAAVAMQTMIAEGQAKIPVQRRAIFRMGVNLGDVVVEGSDLLGDGVNVAARLEQLCPPGGVLISGTAFDQLRGKLDLPLDFIGEQRVKNISQPVRAYAVRMAGRKSIWSLRFGGLRRRLRFAVALLAVFLVAGLALRWFRSADTVFENPAVAVLQFDNLGGDDPTARLAGGITEDIITDLSRYRGLDVIARNSSAVYSGKAVDIRQVGQELNVGYVLEGSVQRQDGQIRVTAQLIDARTGAHLWSERFDRRTDDLFSVQTEIADQVTSQIVGSQVITQAENIASKRARPQDLAAYELTLLATEELRKATEESNMRARDLLVQAVEKDPRLARAWVDLAWTHDLLNGFLSGEAAAQEENAALDAAQKAVELDPNDAGAHDVLGHILGNLGKFQLAEAEFDRALQLNPGSAEILTHYAGWASTFGQPSRGAEAADRAIRLNPKYPVWAGNFFRYAYFMAGRAEDALRIVERQPLENLTRFGWANRAMIYAASGNIERAQAAAKEALAKYPDLTIEGFANDPMTDAEREKIIKTMRVAGFPPCAKPGELSGHPKPVHLPECVASPTQ